MNLGNGHIGNDVLPPREIQVLLSVPAEHGEFTDDHTGDANELVVGVPVIGPKALATATRSLSIFARVPTPLRLYVTLALYISDASIETANPSSTRLANHDMILVHTMQVQIQISNSYTFNASSEFLMVVNSKTASERIQDLRNLIVDELGLGVDCWDVELNGGLHHISGGRKGMSLAIFSGAALSRRTQDY